jgi:hypothetical protein
VPGDGSAHVAKTDETDCFHFHSSSPQLLSELIAEPPL